MQQILQQKGLTVTNLPQLMEQYRQEVPVLLDLTGIPDGTQNPCLVFDEAFFAGLAAYHQPLICGIHAPQEAKVAAKYFPPQQIQAFMPDKRQYLE